MGRALRSRALQLRELRPGEGGLLTQGHTAAGGQAAPGLASQLRDYSPVLLAGPLCSPGGSQA